MGYFHGLTDFEMGENGSLRRSAGVEELRWEASSRRDEDRSIAYQAHGHGEDTHRLGPSWDWQDLNLRAEAHDVAAEAHTGKD